MANKALTRLSEGWPSVIEDLFKPWNQWFDNGNTMMRLLTVPAVNISEHKDDFLVSIAVPGMKKEDFNIDVEGNLITISCEKEESKEEKEAKFTRKEYSYSNFSRSFTLPDEVMKDKIEAHYENGVLKMTLPKKEEAKKLSMNKHIAVK